MGYENVGRVWTPDSLARFLATLSPPVWCKAVTLHHTAAPSLADLPRGFVIQHIENLRHFYRDEKHWSAGPHLFIDDDQIFGMCDLARTGLHTTAFNSFSFGLVVLGDFDAEDPRSGRGFACWTTAASATRVLLDWLGLKAGRETVLFHREDPTTRKTCPGTRINKSWFLELVVTPPIHGTSVASDRPDVGMEWSKWDFRGERWCVPVHEFLMARGVPSATVAGSLKGIGGFFYYGPELLEGAYYVGANSPLRPNHCIWAPARELLELVQEHVPPS